MSHCCCYCYCCCRRCCCCCYCFFVVFVVLFVRRISFHLFIDILLDRYSIVPPFVSCTFQFSQPKPMVHTSTYYIIHKLYHFDFFCWPPWLLTMRIVDNFFFFLDLFNCLWLFFYQRFTEQQDVCNKCVKVSSSSTTILSTHKKKSQQLFIWFVYEHHIELNECCLTR